MSMSSVTGSTPGIYRLVSPSLVTGVTTNAAANDNITFNTNIPSLDYAIRIWRTRYIMGFSAWPNGGLGSANTGYDVQLFAQLTENQTKTSVALTDTSFLDETWMHLLEDGFQSTAASIAATELPYPLEVIHDFQPTTTPWTVATKLNFVVTSVANRATAGAATWKPVIMLEYTLERLDAGLRDYLAKRLQIQGS